MSDSPVKTPDQRYLIVRGRLWRASNPHLVSECRVKLVNDLMDARRAINAAMKVQDTDGLKQARNAVNEAKIALGERGPVWWEDGAKDFNRYLVKNTPYADWFSGLEQTELE